METVERAVASGFFGDDPLEASEKYPAPDKYVLERKLGRGGAGVVWLAQDATLGRPVALKFLLAASEADVERFRREARFAARLEDPAIVRIYETGEWAGRPYIAMEYVPGANFRAAALDVGGVVDVARQVAGALAHAHAAGVVHRDVKPENVLVRDDGRAFVTDFGIARDLRGDVGATISLDGQIMGTPALMSPEQARGEQHSIDARTDVYSLGATLFTKLTGRYPFAGASVVDVLHAVLHEEPPLVRRFNASVPRALEELVLRCMRKRKEDRFASMAGVVAALDDVREGGGGRPTRWFRALVGAPADAPAPTADDSDLAAAMATAREIAEWDADLYRVGKNLPRTFGRLDRIAERLSEILARRPETAWARFFRGVALARRGDLHGALEEMERSIDRVPDRGAAYFELGRLYLALSFDLQESARKHLSVVGTREEMRDARDRLEQAAVAFEEARRLSASLPRWRVEYAQAVRLLADDAFDACVAACDAILQEEPDAEEVWKLRGDALRLAGKPPHESYARALEVRRSYYEAALAMADARLDAGETAAAREALARALAVRPDLHAPLVRFARAGLEDFRRSGDRDALASGLEHARRATSQRPDDYDAAVVLAELLAEAGEFDEAFAQLARAARLPGCHNRVAYLTARTHLLRARRGGPTARADLDAVLANEGQPQATAPDNAPWLSLFAEAHRLR